jgi:hypothetical protein
VRRVLLVSWLVISSTLLASIASHTSTSTSNVDGPLGSGLATDWMITRPRSPTECLKIKKLKWNEAFHGCTMLQVGATGTNQPTYILQWCELLLRNATCSDVSVTDWDRRRGVIFWNEWQHALTGIQYAQYLQHWKLLKSLQKCDNKCSYLGSNNYTSFNGSYR